MHTTGIGCDHITAAMMIYDTTQLTGSTASPDMQTVHDRRRRKVSTDFDTNQSPSCARPNLLASNTNAPGP